MGLSRKTKGAKAKAISRSLESNEDHKARLLLMSERQKKVILSESYEKRLERLAIEKRNTNRSRSNESETQRFDRLDNLKIGQKKKLSDETVEERAARKKKLVDNQKIRLSNETVEERAARKKTLLDNQKIRLSNENVEKRAARKKTLLDNQKIRLSNETAEEKDARIKQIVDSQKIRLSNESVEKRVARKNTVNLRKKQKRSIESSEEQLARLEKRREANKYDQEAFLEDVNDTGRYECHICHKNLYKKQVTTLKKDNIKVVIPDEELMEFPETLVVCHRCKENLTKRKKIPSQAYWNKMFPGEIPAELKVLSALEIRLVSRLIPYLRVVKYEGRFGQFGFKGQTVLFAQDVTEVPDQILKTYPRPMNSIGLIMIVEKRENIVRQREFQVSENRLEVALKWLIENNHLYKDVTLDLENFSIDYREILVENVDIQNENPEDVTDWVTLSKNTESVLRKILRCCRSNMDYTFGIFAGKQALAMSVSFLAKQYLKPIEYWDQLDLEYLLDEGNVIHSVSIENFKKDFAKLLEASSANELELLIDFSNIATKFKIFFHNFVFFFEDIVSKSAVRKVSEFEKVLRVHLESHCNAILSFDNTYIAVAKEESLYFLFDSRARGPNGGPCKQNGNSIVICMNDLDVFIKKVKSHLGCKGFFTITHVQVSLESDVEENSRSTFGTKSPSLHTNPMFKLSSETESEILKDSSETLENAVLSVENKLLVDAVCQSDEEMLTQQFSGNNNANRKRQCSFVFASRHQGDARYLNNSNKQCTAMSVAAIVMCHIAAPETWNFGVIDNVLDAGNIYYSDCDLIRMLRNNPVDQFLNADELLSEPGSMFGHIIRLNIQRTFNESNPGDLPLQGHIREENSLENAINTFFVEMGNNYAIFMCQLKTYAIVKSKENYWIFDPHSCNYKGLPGKSFDFGKAVMISTDQRGLVECLKARIDFSVPDNNYIIGTHFSIHRIEVTVERSNSISNDGIIIDSLCTPIKKVPSEKRKVPTLFSTKTDLKRPKLGIDQTVVKLNLINSLSTIDTLKDKQNNIIEIDKDRSSESQFNLFDFTPLKDALNDVRSEDFMVSPSSIVVRMNEFMMDCDANIKGKDGSYCVLEPLPEQKCKNTSCVKICKDCKASAVYILSASYSQTDFSTEKNFEDITVSVAAIVRAHIEIPSTWYSEVLHSVFDTGKEMHNKIFKFSNLVMLKDYSFPSHFEIYKETFDFEVGEFASEKSYKLDATLQEFFKRNSYGLIRQNKHTYAIMWINENYFIFDPHRCDDEGITYSEGNGCILMTADYSKFAENLFVRLIVPIDGPNKYAMPTERFSLYFVKVTLNSDLKRKEKPDYIYLYDEYTSDKAKVLGSISVMMPIDDTVPRPQEYFETKKTAIDTNDIPIKELIRKTTTPINPFIEKRHEELSFVRLFPYGRNGVNEDREIPITALEYFQARIMGSDSRFHSREYLFYSLNTVEKKRVSDTISICGKIRKGGQKNESLASNLHLTMRAIRGSSAYWNRQLLDLLAMVKQLGPATAFLTLSCNDLHWDDILKECLQNEDQGNVDISKLSAEERQSLIERNPQIISRKFHLRVQSFIKLLKTGDLTNGFKVKDHWYRIEFQQRGSPHCHMLIWLEGFPKLDSPEGIKAMEDLCKCDIPENDPELEELVRKNQIHRHSKKTCYKNGKQTCRFNFPRAACDETKVLEVDSNAYIKNGCRIVQMKRAKGNEFVNNYVPAILRLWKGNMDFQFVTTVSIIYYIAKYTCKCEPYSLNADISAAIKSMIENDESIRKALHRIVNKILNEREVSACECIYRLCHLPLKGSSRDTAFINTSMQSERYRMLRIESENTEQNVYYNNIIDRYQDRPDSLSHLSLAEFGITYKPYYMKKNDVNAQTEDDGDNEYNAEGNNEEGIAFDGKKLPIFKLKDGKSFIQERSKTAVLRCRYFSPTGDKERYFYSLLLLHLPFRDEKEILSKGQSVSTENVEYYDQSESEKAFLEKRDLLRPLRSDCTIQEYKDFEQEINDAYAQICALLSDNSQDPGGPVGHNPDHFLNGTPPDIVEDDEEDVGLPEELDVNPVLINTKKLNGDQQKPFKLVQETIKADLEGKNPPQIRMFITGGAGTGKSFLTEKIIQCVKDAYKLKYPNSKVVEVVAPTGVAARLINGRTIHSALSLQIEKGNKIATYMPLTGNYLEQKRREWQNVMFLIIDEISMVSYQWFKIINERLKELKCSNELFGGIHMILLGDLLQLNPVNGNPIYIQPKQAAELFLFRTFDFYELTRNERQKNDLSFVDILNAQRVGELNADHITSILERVVSKNLTRTGIFSDENATLIAPVTRTVEEHNLKVLTKLTTKTRENPNPPKCYLFTALDVLVENQKGQRPDMSKIVPTDTNQTAGIPKDIELAVGARVMLRRNLNVTEGLVNGALGRVVRFTWPALRKDQLEEGEICESVIVNFDGIGEKIIKPQCFTFNAKGGYGKIERRQIPLILAWAVTCHKMQGVTVDSAVLDLGPDVFAKGQSYVMLSRVRNLDKLLILKPFKLQKLMKKYVNLEALRELKRLRRLRSVPWRDFLNPRQPHDARNQLN